MDATVLYKILLLLTMLSYGSPLALPSHWYLHTDDSLSVPSNQEHQDLITNELSPTYSLSQNCPAGYQLDTSTSTCQPQCIDGCENGICTSPNICLCEPGHEFVLHKCIPVCSNGCKNGYCTAPESCSCFYAFEWNKETEKCTLRQKFTRRRRGLYGSDFLYVQPWSKSTKPTKQASVKRETKTPQKKPLNVNVTFVN